MRWTIRGRGSGYQTRVTDAEERPFTELLPGFQLENAFPVRATLLAATDNNDTLLLSALSIPQTKFFEA